jgi:hypothetical protein
MSNIKNPLLNKHRLYGKMEINFFLNIAYAFLAFSFINFIISNSILPYRKSEGITYLITIVPLIIGFFSALIRTMAITGRKMREGIYNNVIARIFDSFYIFGPKNVVLFLLLPQIIMGTSLSFKFSDFYYDPEKSQIPGLRLWSNCALIFIVGQIYMYLTTIGDFMKNKVAPTIPFKWMMPLMVLCTVWSCFSLAQVFIILEKKRVDN